jgi:hypothetical protein
VRTGKTRILQTLAANNPECITEFGGRVQTTTFKLGDGQSYPMYIFETLALDDETKYVTSLTSQAHPSRIMNAPTARFRSFDFVISRIPKSSNF